MKKNNNKQIFDALIMVFQFGINMIVPILMCTALGVWLGKRYNIPMITIPLFAMGALAGFKNVFRMAKKIYGQDGDSDR